MTKPADKKPLRAGSTLVDAYGHRAAKSHWARWGAALAAIISPLPAVADGLGGLAVVALLMFILVAPLALLGIVFAFVLRAFDKTRAARVVGRINVVICVFLLIFARNIQGRNVFDAFNPWWGTDDAIVVSICLLLIVGNLMFFVRASAGRRAIVAGLLVYIAIQFVGTAGWSVYYEHDPLMGDVTSVRLLDSHHAEAGGKVFRYAAEVTCCVVYDRAVIEPQSGGSWNVVWARPNRDTRTVPRRQSRKGSNWEYRFPFQPSHVADTLIEGATRLDEDWEAADDMLLDVVRARVADDWIERVTRHGADPNFIAGNGDTPLMIAVSRYYGHDEAVALVRAGADPDLRVSGGDTMLHRAARELTDSSDDIAERLLRLGADPMITNDRGKTPLEEAELSIDRTLLNSPERRIGERLVELLRSAANSGRFGRPQEG